MIDPVVDEIEGIYLSGLSDLLERGFSPEHIVKLTRGSWRSWVSGKQLGQRPERYVEEHFVWPVLDALGHSYRTEVYCHLENSYYDIVLETGPNEIFGEVKKLGYMNRAKWDIIKSLGKGIAQTNVGFATDGLQWRIFEVDISCKILPLTDIANFSFENFVGAYIQSTTDYNPTSSYYWDDDFVFPDQQGELTRFCSLFAVERFSA